MTYVPQTTLKDITGNLADITPYGELHTVIPTRLVGGIFSGTALSSYFFTVTNTSGGTTTVSNGSVTLATNTTANGATQLYTSQLARFVGGTSNRFYGRIYLGDSGTANNTRRWGLMNAGATDGIYFKLSGTTFSINTRKGGVETSTTITAPTLTGLNLYEIDYNSGEIYFLINGVLVGTITPTSPYANTLQFNAFIDNTNTASSTTNVTISSLNITVYRLGQFETQPVQAHITTANTYNLKYGPGILHKVTLNNPGGTTITVYDSTTGTGTVLAVINTPAQANPVTLSYDFQFSTGLTVVSTGTWDANVIFQ